MMKFIAVLALLGAAAFAADTVMLYPKRAPMKDWEVMPHSAVDTSVVLEMTVGLYRRNVEKMNELFWEVSIPTHPNYGNHPGHEVVRKLVSPGKSALRLVTSWLRSNGITDYTISRHEDYLVFKAPLSAIERLLKVTFRNYKNERTGKVLARALDEVRIPAHLKKIVEIVAGHSGFPLYKTVFPSKLRSPETNVTPTLLYDVYNVTEFPKPPAGVTNVQSFFQAQAQYVSPSDLQQFCQQMLTGTNAIGFCNITEYVGPNPGEEPGLESSLDSQYILSMSHGAPTWVYSYSNFDFCGDLMHWAYDVFAHNTGNFPHVISMSYGSQALPNYCLGPDVARLNQDVQKMGLMGISVIIASGDDGSGEDNRQTGYNGGLLGNSFPSTIQYATAIGSTTFVMNNAGQQMATTAFGSGGGFSYDYPMLNFQIPAANAYINNATGNNITLPPFLSYNASGRGTPDLSALGENFWVVDGGSWEQVDGTSCSTPTFAGMVTLLNNVRLRKGKTLGFLNPLLYAHPEVFTDIVAGNNDVNSDGYGWYATPGWDPVTGLGTPNVGMMIDLVKRL